MTGPTYLQFWGKAQARDPGGPRWHPLAHHLLDVAAAMEAILSVRPATRANLARLLRLDESAVVRLSVALALLHDIGKFARFFQAKSPDHWPPALGELEPSKLSPSVHTVDGLLLWEEYLADRLVGEIVPDRFGELLPLLLSAFGHHGKPPSRSSAPVGWVFGAVGLSAAEAYVRDVIGLAQPIVVPDRLTEHDLHAASWPVAGLITLADWIGSRFEYHEPKTVAEYWPIARERAAGAVIDTGLVAARAAGTKTFVELTGCEMPTPLQQWAADVVIPDGPALFLLEDVTGAGKTEAAQMLVHRLLTAGRASGAYWAMPTQATANAMFDRQRNAIAALFEDGARPSLSLVHGQAWLRGAFRDLAIDAGVQGLADSDLGEDDDLPASIACAAFLSEDRRASLLADVGAGTVDQAFLGVHPSKFNALRLAGLADKVLILDEVHAYDAYMGVEATTLLAFHAALGGSAIVLSATLLGEERARLAKAWCRAVDPTWGRLRGLFGSPPAPLTTSQNYPLATIVSAAGAVEIPTPAANASVRTVRVRMVHDIGSAVGEVLAAQAKGGAVAWVRNTVDDCLAAAALLRKHGVEPLVFHARFAQADRQGRELEVMRRFGFQSTADVRAGQVIVATQVIEQSLDLDFDFILTDLAPMDLIIQRAGRLWRHQWRNTARPEGIRCEMVVFSPDPYEAPSPNWVGGVFKGTGAVYGKHGVLWCTAELLSRYREIRTPDMVRALIEGAYDEGNVPEALQAADDKARGEDAGDAALAQFAVLKVEEGYGGSLRSWETDLRVMTRIGRKQTTVRLAKLAVDGEIVPWFGNAEGDRKAWALSEVRVSASKIPLGATEPVDLAAAARRVRGTWGRFEEETPLVVLRSEDGCWIGEVFVRQRRVGIRYSTQEGLAFDGGDHAE